MSRRWVSLILVVAVAGCGRNGPTDAQKAKALAYQRDALCICLATKTWLRECLEQVRTTEDGWWPSIPELMHAECLVKNRRKH